MWLTVSFIAENFDQVKKKLVKRIFDINMNDWKILPVKITCHSQFVQGVLERSCSAVSKSWFLVFLFLWGSLLVLVNCATISACLNEERKRLTKCYKAASNSLDNNMLALFFKVFFRLQSLLSSLLFFGWHLILSAIISTKAPFFLVNYFSEKLQHSRAHMWHHRLK